MLKKVLPASLEAFYIGRHPAPDWEPFQKLDEVERPDQLQGARNPEE
ncbi:MAG: hypothetical protein ABSE95_05775 [Thermodesulfobacteriota bacterium]